MPADEHWISSGEAARDRWFLGTLASIKAPSDVTGGRLSIVEFTHPAGFATPRHVHHDEDEGFYVLSGSISGFCGDRTWQADEGSFIWLPRGLPHGYSVDGERTVRTLAITVPGGFDQFVVELSEPAGEPVLPATVVVPELDVLLEVAARHGQEVLGPPGSPSVSGPADR
jgi:quercetin dioxygenase-like cupin family protein